MAASRVIYGHYDDGVRFDQDPEELWDGLVQAVRQLGTQTSLSAVAGIGVVGQAPTMVWVDDAGVPLTRLMGWRDVRAEQQVEHVQTLMSQEWQSDNLGYVLPASAGFAPARLSWFAVNHPELLTKAAAVLSLKDLAVFRLTGELVTDAVNTRGLSHALTGRIATDLIEALGVDPSVVPPVREPWDTAGVLRPKMADHLGLPAHIPVATGWGDLFASMLSIRALNGTDCEFNITGTAEAAGATSPGSLHVPGLLSMPVPHGPVATYGSTQAGGGSVAWLRSKLLRVDEQWIDHEVAARCAMAPSVLFLPHLGGERAPLWDAQLRGAFLGMDATHDRVDLARAVLEGVAFSIRQLLTRVESARQHSLDSPVIVAGAAARNQAWNQIKADILGRPVEICRIAEPSAVGAAILAVTSAGEADSVFEAAERMSPRIEVIEPNHRYRHIYNELYALYDSSQAQLKQMHEGLERVRYLGRRENEPIS